MPEKTLDAVADHGEITGDTVTGAYADAAEVLDALEQLGISYADVTALLEREGVEKFEASWDELLDEAQSDLDLARADVGAGRQVSALGVVASGPAADAIAAQVPELVEAQFASKLFAQDATLWGPDAESESAIRLSWVNLPRTLAPARRARSRALREQLRAEGVDRVVLCGMGGSSLAPEVICATAGVDLVVLDSSQPDMVRDALVELDAHRRRRLEQVRLHRRDRLPAPRLPGARSPRPASTRRARIVVVTDPGSPLDEQSRADGYRVINADPNVGGRYSALTAFGLVPSGLAGADIEALLDDAEAVADVLSADDDANPGLRLGAAMAGTNPLRDKLVLVDDGSGIVGFADWAEQLIAESTGKQGTGILPVVVGGASRPRGRSPRGRRHRRPPGERRRRRRDDDAADAHGRRRPLRDRRSAARSGAQLLLWEVATAAAGRLLGINPFDQPDVESAKKAARALLDQGIGTADAPRGHRRCRRDPRARRRLAR